MDIYKTWECQKYHGTFDGTKLISSNTNVPMEMNVYIDGNTKYLYNTSGSEKLFFTTNNQVPTTPLTSGYYVRDNNTQRIKVNGSTWIVQSSSDNGATWDDPATNRFQGDLIGIIPISQNYIVIKGYWDDDTVKGGYVSYSNETITMDGVGFTLQQ